MTAALLDYPRANLVLDATTSTEHNARLHACAKEPWTVRWIEAIPPGSVLADVGANVGPYTLVAASRGLVVLAVEPGYANYAKLCENVRLNRLEEWVYPLCMALAAGGGSMVLTYSSVLPGAADHTNGPPAKPGKHQYQQRVFCLPLDALTQGALPRPTHLKIDVDGAEVAVLDGAVQTLSTATSVLIEAEFANVAAVSERLTKAGLTLVQTYDRRDGRPIPNIVYLEWERK